MSQIPNLTQKHTGTDAPKAFSIYPRGIVKGQPRQRFRAFAVNGKMRGAGYTPSVAEEWKACIIRELDKVKPERITGPACVCIVAYFPRPKKHFTKKGLRPDAPVYCASKPDVDNIAKLIYDVLVTWGAMDDDAAVVVSTNFKRYEDEHHKPGATVEVREMCDRIDCGFMTQPGHTEGGMP